MILLAGSVALLVATIVAIELTWATRVLPHFASLGVIAPRTGRILARRYVSEWAKERAMRLMSARLMLHSLRGAGFLTIVASPFLIAMALEAYWPFGLKQAYTNWPVRLILLALSVAYVVVRRRFRPASQVRTAPVPLERQWQRLALSNPAVLDITFDLERAAFKPLSDADAAASAPIFITGLARAGTTILTRILHEQQGMASLTYRDLPFPLAPNGWGALSQKRRVARSERGHGDGIFHDLDSAEAIEEVFWRHFEGPRYAGATGLSPISPQPETLAAFRDYVGLVRRRRSGARYLSKNNANVLRLPALAEAFPQVLFVHPFRAPLQQAKSLLRQHRLSLQLAAQDSYRTDFMRWLGHYEFGADQRPFLFPGHPSAGADRNHIDYWLQLWISVHTALLTQPDAVWPHQIFLDYDALCNQPSTYAAPLALALGLDTLALDDLRPAPLRSVEGANPRLLEQAGIVHKRLQARSLKAATRTVMQPTKQLEFA